MRSILLGVDVPYDGATPVVLEGVDEEVGALVDDVFPGIGCMCC